MQKDQEIQTDITSQSTIGIQTQNDTISRETQTTPPPVLYDNYSILDDYGLFDDKMLDLDDILSPEESWLLDDIANTISMYEGTRNIFETTTITHTTQRMSYGSNSMISRHNEHKTLDSYMTGMWWYMGMYPQTVQIKYEIFFHSNKSLSLKL